VYARYPINCEISAGGYFVCENVRSLERNLRNEFIYIIVVLGSPLKTLDVLAADLVVEDMSYLVCRNFFSGRTLMNTVDLIRK
jgi:hypothetical protein